MNDDDLKLGLQRIGERLGSRPRGGCVRLFEHAGICGHEPAHSNLLAWVLDPRESHGLGEAFLREFWRRAFSEIPPCFAPVDVKREENAGAAKPDIVVRGPFGVLVIEVKLWSTEHDNQTMKYAEAFKGAKYVYLTRTGESAQCKEFISVRWSAVREALDGCASSGEAEWLLRQFADHIARDLEE